MYLYPAPSSVLLSYSPPHHHPPTPLLFCCFFLHASIHLAFSALVLSSFYRRCCSYVQQRGRTRRSKVREETEGRAGGWVGGWMWEEGGARAGGRAQSRSVRSGAAPPVIIRVTAARARLRAACTRRDVLPREKSEHLSVPPRRQQPPTSLSNSTQLVTRSPNSYFLSLALTHVGTHARRHTRARARTHARTPASQPTLSTLFFFFFALPCSLARALRDRL